MHRIRPALLCALLATLLCAAPALASGADDPLRGQRPFVDCQAWQDSTAATYSALYWYREARRRGDTAQAALYAKLALVPTAKWFAGASIRPLPTKMLERFLARVDDPQLGGPQCETPLAQGQGDAYSGSYPIIAIRAFDESRCQGWDGGEWNQPGGAYTRWIDAFAHGLQLRWNGPFRYRFYANTIWPEHYFAPVARKAVVIVEPDALAFLGSRSHCLTRAGRRNRLALLSYAAKRLGALPGVTTYLDAGASDWLKVGETVRLLRAAGVRYVRGFATNATHFERTSSEVRFGDQVARRLGKHYVVNTAENGHGPLPERLWTAGVKSKWCNPSNSALGTQPTTRTASKWADAYLWISRPGLSSNGKVGVLACGRGPIGNVFWPQRALGEARGAAFGAPAWPVPAL